jgi:nicotinamidase-related amidase
MTTLPDRPNTALLVIDVQNHVVARAARRDEVVTNIADLVDQARAGQVPVVWVQDSVDGDTGTEGWRIVPELSVDEREPLVHKDDGDAFEQVIAHTNLYWGMQEAPRRTAGTVTAADVTFGTG